MYGKHVHIKAVTYVTFPNKQDVLPELMYQTEVQEELSNTYIYILAVCLYNVCDVLCTLPIEYMALEHAC